MSDEPTVQSNATPPVDELRMKLAVQQAIIKSQEKGFAAGDDVGYGYDLKAYVVKTVDGDHAAIAPLFDKEHSASDPSVIQVKPLDELYLTDILIDLLKDV